MAHNTGFRNQPPAVKQLDGKRWEVVETDFSYRPWKIRDIESVGLDIHIPQGFVTDFASIPRPMWSVLPPTGLYGSAAIIHDYLCREAEREANYIVPTHKIAAYIFGDAMTELGVGSFRRWSMVRAVVMFGPKWNKNT